MEEWWKGGQTLISCIKKEQYSEGDSWASVDGRGQTSTRGQDQQHAMRKIEQQVSSQQHALSLYPEGPSWLPSHIMGIAVDGRCELVYHKAGETPYSCKYCGWCFARCRNLKIHMRKIHSATDQEIADLIAWPKQSTAHIPCMSMASLQCEYGCDSSNRLLRLEY